MQNITSHAFVPLFFAVAIVAAADAAAVICYSMLLSSEKSHCRQIDIVMLQNHETKIGKKHTHTHTHDSNGKKRIECMAFVVDTRDIRCVVYITLKKYNNNRLLQQPRSKEKNHEKKTNENV